MIADQYKNRYLINGISLFDQWGVIVEKGGYEELMKEPQRKQGYVHSWLDQNGTDRYVEPYFETRTVTLSFVFVCINLADYLSKKTALFGLLRSGYVTLATPTLQREWQLLYNNETNVEYLTDIYAGEEVIARHTLTFFDDMVDSNPFDPNFLLTNELGEVLTDENGIFLTINIQ